jgi:L-fuculose-phosphate aldolase
LTAASLLSDFRRAGADLAHLGLVVPGTGNLSVWTPEGVVVTREGAALHRLEAADLCLIARATEPPPATPAYDTPIHRAVYVRSKGRAVAHAHPRHTVARSFGLKRFEPPDLEGRHALGFVPVVSPMRSVIDVIAEALETARIVIVEGHGVYARGAELDEAVALIALLEESAAIASLR